MPRCKKVMDIVGMPNIPAPKSVNAKLSTKILDGSFHALDFRMAMTRVRFNTVVGIPTAILEIAQAQLFIIFMRFCSF